MSLYPLRDLMKEKRFSGFPKKILIVLSILSIIYLTNLSSTNALKVDLIANSDKCKYIPQLEKDYCFSTYNISDLVIFDNKEINFKFKTDIKNEYSANIKDLSTNTKISNYGSWFIVNITGYKNPYQNIDNVFCYMGECFYEFAWWNTSYSYRYNVNCTNYGSSNVTMPTLINDTWFNVSGSYELVYCNMTAQPNRTTCGYVYFNNATDYVCVDANQTGRVGQFINEGNGSYYGEMDSNIQALIPFNLSLGDLSVYKNVGQNQNGMGYPPESYCVVGRCTYYDGAEDRFEIPNIYDSQTGNGAIAFWFNPFQNNTIPISKKHGGSYSDYFRVEHLTSGQLELLSKVGGTIRIRGHTDKGISSYGLPGSWTHVIITWNSSEANGLHFYFNGTEWASTVATWSSPTMGGNNNNTRVGEPDSGGSDYYGYLDELTFYNKTLTPDEAMAIYNNTIGSLQYHAYAPLDNFTFYNFTGNGSSNASTNLTGLDNFSTTYCLNDDILVIQTYSVTINASGTFNETNINYIRCQYGCANETYYTLGYAGCKESDLQLVLTGMLIILGVFGVVAYRVS